MLRPANLRHSTALRSGASYYRGEPQAAAKFHYSANTLHSLMRDVRAGNLQWFPLSKKKGPQQRHTPEHIQAYDHEPVLGLYAGLNQLPKSTYMASYSCQNSEAMLFAFQERVISKFRERYPSFYGSEFINLDFHSIPHFGTESEMEKLWCGARGKALKGAQQQCYSVYACGYPTKR